MEIEPWYDLSLSLCMEIEPWYDLSLSLCMKMIEYGSTPYVGMARGKISATYNAYKIIWSDLSSD